jgi:hypothetical protein
MMAAKPDGWRVTGQAPNQTDVSADGTVVEGTRVYFQMNSGTQGSVFVPQTSYNAESVKQRIIEAVSHLHAVNNLTG